MRDVPVFGFSCLDWLVHEVVSIHRSPEAMGAGDRSFGEHVVAGGK